MDLPLTKVQYLGISLDLGVSYLVVFVIPTWEQLAAWFMMVHHQPVGSFRTFNVSSRAPHVVGNM